MKTLIAILVLLSFLQSSIIPLDLVLVVLIIRAYIRPDKNNLFLAFGFGLLNSHLNTTSLGLQSLTYLILVALTESLSKARLAGNPILIAPLTFILVSINQILISLFLHQSLDLFPKNLWEAVLSLPIFFLIKVWEERFIVRKDIKLKL